MRKEFNFKGGNGMVFEELSQFIYIKEFNWCDFHFLHCQFEYDRSLGGLEFSLIILGFGIWLRFQYPTERSKEEWKKIESRMNWTHYHAYASSGSLKDLRNKKKDQICIFRTKKDAKLYAKMIGEKPVKISYYESYPQKGK